MQHDLLNDTLVALGHADRQGKAKVVLGPTSHLVGEVLRIFRENRYIDDFSFVANGRGGQFDVTLSKRINACGVIKPRVAVHTRDLEKYEARFLPAQDFGLLILSTNQGVMGHAKARELKIGGKLLAYVY